MPAALVANAWRRLRFTDQVAQAQFDALVAEAQGVGFLRNAVPLDRLFGRQP
jgi:NitT/TauT family transport system substrate-binding protein